MLMIVDDNDAALIVKRADGGGRGVLFAATLAGEAS